MSILLKDMPEHAERIEGNTILEADITAIVDMDGQESDAIMQVFADFVNQNYIWKGDLK